MSLNGDGTTKKTLRLPYLSNIFLQSLDETQIKLMNLACFAFSNYAILLELRDPLQVLIDQIKFEAPILFSKTQ